MRLPLPVRPTAPTVVALLALGVLAAPAASAADQPPPDVQVGEVATPAAGRLTAHVTTTAPYVRARLAAPDAGELVGLLQRVGEGGVDLDLVTWGLPASATLTVDACADGDATTCQPATSVAVAPLDAVPEVTWPDAAVLEPGDPDYVVTTSDPDGGGTLRVRWTSDRGVDGGTELARSASGGESSVLRLPDGDLTLQVRRCDHTGTVCHDLVGVSRRVRVQRDLLGTVQVLDHADAVVGPRSTLRVTVTPRPATLDADVVVRDADTGAVLPGRGGRVAAVPVDAGGAGGSGGAGGTALLPLDLAGLPSGAYRIEVSGSFDVATVGPYAGELGALTVVLDADAPRDVTVRASPSTFYPARDGYRDSVRLITDVAPDDAYDVAVRHEIRDRAGRLVRTLESDFPGALTWDGRDASGAVVPAGRYTVATVATDGVGNATRGPSVTITASGQRLRQHVLTRTVSAAGSMVDRYVGRCSRLRQPSSHGWSGSLGLETATRCRGTVRQTLVSTLHALRVPDALRYDSLKVTVEGGAARGAPRSLAYLGYARTDGSTTDPIRLASTVGPHAGPGVAAEALVFGDRTVGWEVFTAAGARYDLRRFTVRLVYTRLE